MYGPVLKVYGASVKYMVLDVNYAVFCPFRKYTVLNLTSEVTKLIVAFHS